MHSISDAPLSAGKANHLNYMRREFPTLSLVVSVLPVKTTEIRYEKCNKVVRAPDVVTGTLI